MIPLHPCIFMSKFPFIFIYIDIDILYLNNTLIFWIFLHKIFTKSIIINGIIKSVYNLSYIYYNTIYLFSIVFVLLIIENQYFFYNKRSILASSLVHFINIFIRFHSIFLKRIAHHCNDIFTFTV